MNTLKLFDAVVKDGGVKFRIVRRQGGDLDYIAISDITAGGDSNNAVCIDVTMIDRVIDMLTAARRGCPVLRSITGDRT